MPLLALLGQSLATFAASFGVGILPLMFESVSGKRLKVVSIFGMGLLVGAALTIIIPEGVSTLYTSLPTNKEGEKHAGEGRLSPNHVIGITLLAGFALMLLVETLTPHPAPPEHSHEHLPTSPHSDAEHGYYGSRDSSPPQSIQEDHPARYPLKSHPSHSSVLTPSLAQPGNGHGNGFPGGAAPAPKLQAERMTERMNSSTTLFTPKPKDSSPKNADFRKQNQHSYSSRRSNEDEHKLAGGEQDERVPGLSATLGLCVHGAADGIAMGAAALSTSGALGLSVFLAVVLHKGPTALGLTTTLLSLGLTHQQARNRLLIFSSAAPLGAVITYFLVRLFGAQTSGFVGDGVDGLQWWTGVVLLFSGGSFLYVATVISPISHSDSHQDHEHAVHDEDEVELSQWLRLSLLLAGMVLPLGLSSLMGHGH